MCVARVNKISIICMVYISLIIVFFRMKRRMCAAGIAAALDDVVRGHGHGRCAVGERHRTKVVDVNDHWNSNCLWIRMMQPTCSHHPVKYRHQLLHLGLYYASPLAVPLLSRNEDYIYK
ncbi:hypothetical protein VPH35_066005 [Triticum aestivum]